MSMQAGIYYKKCLRKVQDMEKSLSFLCAWNVQITERREQEKLARLKLQEEEEEEEKADMEYQDFVQQETERLRQRGYKPEVWTCKQALYSQHIIVRHCL